MKVDVEIVFNNSSFSDAYQLWNIFTSEEKELNKLSVTDGYSGNNMLFSDVTQYLKNKNSDDFLIELLEGSISFSYIANLKFSRLDIKNICSSIEEAERWIMRIVQEKGFVQARIFDSEYDLWQIMDDIFYYEVEGRNHDELPKKSNELPFPLDMEIIDTSNNPGRWILREGYIESIGSVMWLSKELIKKLGVNLQDIIQCEFLKVKEMGNIIKLQIMDECFTIAEGNEAVLQNKLRKLLYPE